MEDSMALGSLMPVSGGGSFTKKNIDTINSNFAALVNPDLWVRPQNTSPTAAAEGTYERPFASFTAAGPSMRPGMVVGLLGVTLEEFSSPRVNDITVLGMGNLPRQATTSGIANGGGSTWLSPSGGTGALLQPNGQGWRVQNVFFNNSATAAGCIKLVNAGDPPTSNCSEKTSIIGCFLTGTDDGVAALDLPNNVLIDGCTFFGFSGSGDLGISSATGAGTGTLNNWVIQNCDFLGNANHITAPFTSSTIRNNRFSYIYGSVTTTTQILLSGGSNNDVYGNRFDIPSTTNLISGMFSGGTNDRWGPNYTPNAVTTTIFLFSVPTS
jgi:hypothetical protein